MVGGRSLEFPEDSLSVKPKPEDLTKGETQKKVTHKNSSTMGWGEGTAANIASCSYTRLEIDSQHLVTPGDPILSSGL